MILPLARGRVFLLGSVSESSSISAVAGRAPPYTRAKTGQCVCVPMNHQEHIQKQMLCRQNERIRKKAVEFQALAGKEVRSKMTALCEASSVQGAVSVHRPAV